MGKLEGKVAVVTGGGSGIGAATARLFVAEGARVFLAGRRLSAVEAVARQIGAGATAVRCDIADLDSLDELFATVRAEAGRLDVVHANAGIGESPAVAGYAPEQFDRIFAVNARGTFFTVQKAVPLMTSGGSVILTGATAGRGSGPRFGVYDASKAAVRSYARSWTADLAPKGIRVNVLSPGAIDSELFDRCPPETLDAFVAAIPLGRAGTPEEVAAGALFLAGDDSSFITGIELFVDGGTGRI